MDTEQDTKPEVRHELVFLRKIPTFLPGPFSLSFSPGFTRIPADARYKQVCTRYVTQHISFNTTYIHMKRELRFILAVFS